MAPRFYSKEWCEMIAKESKENEAYLKKVKGFTAKYIFIVTDDPDGNDIKVRWHFEDGKVVQFDYDVAPAPSTFRIGQEHWDDSMSMAKTESSYEVWKKVQLKQMTVLGAMGAKLYKVEGDLIKGMAMMAYNTAFADIQIPLPCEY